MTYSLNTLHSSTGDSQPVRQRALRFAHEITLIAGFVALLFWLLAMFSYTPSDAAWSTSGTGGSIKNWGGRLGAWQSFARANEVCERLAFDERHRQVMRLALGADVEDGADVGMVERGSGTGFAVEALQDLRAIVGPEMGDLERHLPFELCVLGEIDRAHAALAQLLEDAVAAKDLRHVRRRRL